MDAMLPNEVNRESQRTSSMSAEVPVALLTMKAHFCPEADNKKTLSVGFLNEGCEGRLTARSGRFRGIGTHLTHTVSGHWYI